VGPKEKYMHKKTSWKALGLLLLFSCSQGTTTSTKPKNTPTSSPPSAISEEEPLKAQVLLRLLSRTLSEGHLHPQPIDDKLSEKFFAHYIEQVDYSKRLLTQDDFNTLAKYKTQIDDQINGGNYEFFNVSYEIQKKQEANIKNWCETSLEKPIDFTIKEEIIDDPKKLGYAKDDAELQERWRKTTKLWTLSRIVDQLEIQEKAKEKGDKTIPVKSYEVIEEEARKSSRKFCNNIYDRLSTYDREERRGAYLNTFAELYDPHTTYFPPADKANFEIEASGALQGIGARLKEEDGYTVVSEIVPGSPAAIQGELTANDAILEVMQENAESVNIVGMDIDDAIKMIRGKKGTRVTLTVKKLDGNIKKISIVRDIVLIEESYAKSVILEKNGKRVGLIDLPSFYADFGGAGGHSCADDIRNELKKLSDENIDQLIIDLRNNGGGSLSDTIRMVGFFIEKGPVVQVRDSEGTIEVLSDKDPSIQYKGDLVVLINEQSASASEIFAAAIQDYKRGIILGSKASFGKGTVQQLLDLDRLLPEDSKKEVAPLGALKLTLQKFYRINGGSTQLKGVASDVVLTDVYSYLDIGEHSLDNPAPWDEIKAASYQEWKSLYSLSILQAKSKARTSTNPIFQAIDENAKRFKRNTDDSTQPLDLNTYRAEKKAREEESKKFEGIMIPTVGLVAKAPLNETKSASEASQKRTELWYTLLTKDPYVEEAINILSEMRQP
jgi:carboxyl-terminal processing protease